MYFVPAFTGLGAPYWNGNARGQITGLTRGSSKAHITRAAIEAMAYSTRDLINAAETDGNIKINAIKIDGGASSNDFLAEFTANVCQKTVIRPAEKESTALGAAYLCGLGLGLFTTEDLTDLPKEETSFLPEKDEKYKKYYAEWQKSVERCLL